MPELTIIDLPVTQVKPLDSVAYKGHWLAVAEVKRGTKNATIIEPDQRRVAIPLDAVVTVKRLQDTAEEKAAKEREFLEGRLEYAIDQVKGWAASDPVAYAQETIAKHGWNVSSALAWDGAKMVAVTVQHEYGTIWERTVEAGTEPAVALLMLEREVKAEAMRIARYGSSRSTSVWSNTVEDSRREACFKVTEDWAIMSGIDAARKLGHEITKGDRE